MEDNNDTGAIAVRRDFGGSETQLAILETTGTAAAAGKKAAIEARYVMALRNPRNLLQVRQDLLAECKRPAFANNKSALYHKPIGKDGVEGLGIRFVEVALRCMRNVLVESEMVFEDKDKEIHRITVTDLESNLTYPMDVKISKTVERSKPSADGSFLSVRKNSYGRDVYTVHAEDDDLLNKRAALISKAVRTLGMRIIPGDMQDEAEALIRQIRKDKATEDPKGEQKKIADAFAGLNVKVAELEEYLGHTLDSCSPDELVKLRAVYGSISDGEANWASYLEQVRGDRAGTETGDTTASGRKKPKEKGPETKPGDQKAGDNKQAATTKLRRVFDEEGVQLGEVEVAEGATEVKVGIIDYVVIKITDKSVIAKLKPVATTEQKPAATDSDAKATPEQVAMIKQKLAAFEISEADVEKAFGMAFADIPGRLIPEVRRWIGAPMDPIDLNFGK